MLTQIAPSATPRARPVLWLALCGLIGGCSVHSVARPADTAPAVSLPGAWSQPASGAEAPARWWTLFGDAQLDALMARVERDNLSLRQAWARLDISRAAVAQARAGYWPSLDASVEASRGRTALFGAPRDLERYQATLAARYELDLWGRVGALTDAAQWSAEATRLDLETLALSLSAETVATWLTLSAAMAEQALIEQQIAANREALDTLGARFEQGLSTAVAVAQQRSATLALESLVPPLEAQVAVQRHRLAALAGQPAGVALPAPSAELPAAPALPATGVPGEILRRRPDLRALQHRAAVADAQVAAALAERFPQFAITASVGTGGVDPAGLLTQWLWNIAGSLTAPLIDGGQRAAAVSARRAEVRGAMAALAEGFVEAVGEVEGALVRIDRQSARLAALEAERAAAGTLVEETRARYLQGLADYLPVVTAVRGLHATERNLLRARQALLMHHVDLHRAIGGGWSPARPSADQPPATPAPVATAPTPARQEEPR